MTMDYGRVGESAGKEWGGAIPFGDDLTPGDLWSPSDGLTETGQRKAKHLHYAAKHDLAPGLRYEIRLDEGARGICWYRCEAMDAETDWGEASGTRDGYILVGRFVTPPDSRGVAME